MENKSSKKRKVLWIITGTVIISLVAFRLMLPSIVLRKVNQKLTEIDGYQGSVHDIDVFLLAGSYTIKDLALSKTGGEIPVPFFAAKAIELSIEWKALFKGDLVGEIEVDEPQLNYVKGPTTATSQTSIDKDWTKVVDELIPLRINRFEVTQGAVHYRDFHSSPKVDMAMSNVHLLATNLTNADDKGTLLPATVYGSASLYEGNVTLNMRLNPLNETPLFDMNAELTTMSLTNFNDFLKAYGKFDVQKGTFSLYAEAATRENKVVGYAKPVIKDMDVLELKEDGPAFNKMWEGAVGAVAWVFKNHPKDQLATQVKFEGDMKNPDVSTWSVVGETLENAFIRSLMPSINNSITLTSVNNNSRKGKRNGGDVAFKDDADDDKKKKGFIKRIFKKREDKGVKGKDDNEKRSGREKRKDKKDK